MAREQKQSTGLGLASYTVLIEDTSYYSDYFRVSNFVSQFTSGRNGFLVGGTGRLKPNSQILVELTDSAGNTVFNAPIANYVEGGSRLVHVEVYKDTPKGQGTLVLMGEALTMPDGSPVPSAWEKKYNVRWKVPVHFEPSRKNTSPIRFFSVPDISVTESPNQQTRNVTRTYVTESNFNFNMTQLLQGQVHQGYYIDLNLVMSGSSVDSMFHFTDNKILGKFTGSIIRREKSIVEDSSGNPVDVNHTAPTSSLSVNWPISTIFNNKFAFTSGSATFTDGSKIVGLSNVISGSFRENLSYYTFESASLTYFSRSIVEYTSSLSFRYPVDTPQIISNSSASVLTFRLNNLNTSTGEVARVRISNKPFLDKFSAYKTLYEFQPGISNILIESSSEIGGGLVDSNFPIGSFVSQSYPHTYWVASYVSQSGNLDTEYYNTGSGPHISLITSSFQPGNVTQGMGRLLNGIYVYETSSLYTGSHFFGTRKPFTVFQNTEYTLKYNVSYQRRSTFPNSPSWPTEYTYGKQTAKLQVYLTKPTSSMDQTSRDNTAVPIISDPLGILIDEITITDSDKSNFYDRQVNFNPPRDGQAHLRFVIIDGYWEFSDVQIYPAEEFGFSFDELIFTADNRDIKDATHVFKTEFFDINNNSVNLSVESDPIDIIGPQVADAIGSLVWTRTHLTGDGVTVAFTLSGSAVTDSTFVLMNGLEHTPTEDYTVSGTTITFVTAPPNGAELSVRSAEIL